MRALLERPTQRTKQRGALARRREDRALEPQRVGVLTLETHGDAQCGETIGRERGGDLIDGRPQREDELLARHECVFPHAPRADTARRRVRTHALLVLGAREGMRPRGATAEALEDGAARKRGEVPDASHSQEPELVHELRVDGQHLDR